MQPAVIVQLEKMPRLATGKPDRRGLSEVEQRGGRTEWVPGAAPAGPTPAGAALGGAAGGRGRSGSGTTSSTWAGTRCWPCSWWAGSSRCTGRSWSSRRCSPIRRSSSWPGPGRGRARRRGENPGPLGAGGGEQEAVLLPARGLDRRGVLLLCPGPGVRARSALLRVEP